MKKTALFFLILSAVCMRNASAQDISIRLIERNALRLETSGSLPIVRHTNEPISEQLAGSEESDCRPYGRQSAATASADVREISRQEGRISFSISAATSAQGGHYRSCEACIGGSCIIVKGNDTTAHASTQSVADVAITFSNDISTSPYLVDVVSSSSGRAVSLKMVGPSGAEIKTAESGSYVVNAQPGATFLLQAAVESFSQNKGSCCHDDKVSAATIDVRIRKAPLLMYRQNLEPLISGGVRTRDYSSVGAILIDGQMHCTATLVGPRTLLTAAHCLKGYEAQLDKFTFLLGATVSEPDISSVRVIEFEYPKGTNGDPFSYNSKTYEDDIGLVYLESTLSLPPVLLHQGVPSWNEIHSRKTKLVFVGYGYDVVSGEKVQDGIKRTAAWPIELVENRRVAFDVYGKSTCKGDSGGPAFVVTDNQTMQVGITSTGTEDCRRGYETRVDAYLSWLRDRIR